MRNGLRPVRVCGGWLSDFLAALQCLENRALWLLHDKIEEVSSELGAGSLEGRRFRYAAMGAEGEASEATVFEYHERDGVIWARYEGGAVRIGFLVGTRRDDQLDFRYTQLNENGETSTGHCSTTVSTLPDGRIRLDEIWEWESKPGAGTSTAEEIAQGG